MNVATSMTPVSPVDDAALSRISGLVRDRVRLFDRVATGTLIAFAILWLIPLAWALDTALKPNGETTQTTWVIHHPTLASFWTILHTDIVNWYASSFLTSAITTLGTLVTASLAAYPLSRMRFRYKGVAFWLIVAGIMIPGQALIVPLFREFSGMHLLNTYWAVALPHVPSAIAVFVFKQFFDGLPKELEEAARADGAGFFRIYMTILMPLTRPAISAVAIFTFVWSWNNLLWPLLVLTDPRMMTIPVGLATVQGSYGIRYADTMASAILGAIPLVAVFLLFQRRIVEGIAGTGLKG